MTKAKMILVIATTFVATSIIMGTTAYAAQGDSDPFSGIIQKLDEILQAITGLPDQSDINDAGINIHAVDFLFTQLDSADLVECTSDSDYIAYLNAHVSGTGDTLQVGQNFGTLSTALGLTVTEDKTFIIPGQAGVFRISGSGDSTNHVSMMVTIQANRGATVECISQ